MHLDGMTIAFAVLLIAPAAAAEPAAPAKPAACFFAPEFQNWKAPDAKTIYIRVNVNQYYRLDLANACPALLGPDSHLVTKFHGPDTVCSALDWDLQVSQGFHDIAEPCIVKTMTALTPADAAAMPRKFRP